MINEIGLHRTRCGSIMDGLGDLMGNSGNETAQIFYSDPPWGEPLIKYFETLKTRQTGVQSGEPPTIFDFLAKFFELARIYTQNDSPIFIEYSVDGEGDILQAAASQGIRRITTLKTRYRSGSTLRPMHLHVMSRGHLNIPEGYRELIEGNPAKGTESLMGTELVQSAMAPWAAAGSIVLDPCCGLGTTARAALALGMRFRGNELNSARLEKTHEVLNAKARTKSKAVPNMQAEVNGPQ